MGLRVSSYTCQATTTAWICVAHTAKTRATKKARKPLRWSRSREGEGGGAEAEEGMAAARRSPQSAGGARRGRAFVIGIYEWPIVPRGLSLI